MGKIIVLILGLFMLTSCVKDSIEVKTESVYLRSSIIKEPNGCTYKYTNHYNGGVDIINLTKDSLEVEYYKSQIEMNNKHSNYEI